LFFIFSFLKESEKEREIWLGYWKSRVSQRGFWSSSRVIQKPSPSRTQKREKKKEKIRARKRPRETTPSRTRTSRNRAEFGRNERPRDEVYRPTFRLFFSSSAFSLFLNTSLSLVRANARGKIPLQVFSSLPQKREKNLGSHAKTRVHKKINKKSLSGKRVHRANVYRVRKLRHRRRKMRTLVAKEVDNMIFVCVCGGETSKVMEMETRRNEDFFRKKKNRLLFCSV